MSRKIFNIVIFMILLFMCPCVISNSFGAQTEIAQDRALEIANDEAERLGYDVNSMAKRITRHHTPWSELLPKDSDSEYVIERQKKLVGKEYWIVYFYPKAEFTIGGGVGIFIDANTGEVITTYRGK